MSITGEIQKRNYYAQSFVRKKNLNKRHRRPTEKNPRKRPLSQKTQGKNFRKKRPEKSPQEKCPTSPVNKTHRKKIARGKFYGKNLEENRPKKIW